MPAALAELNDLNRFFWTGGADGHLRILRCSSCGAWLHPPAPICPRCLSREVSPQIVSGIATIEAVTVNHQSWTAETTSPFAIARVSLDEDRALHLTTRIVGVAPDAVFIGQRVKVRFEPREEQFLPFFEPV
jgi:uncharacterized OB-fold protein